MSSIFPIRETVSLDSEREPRLIELDEDTADEVFEALSSGTTRKIFLALHEQPQTASDLAEVTDTSVQNVQYHLEKLTDAELVEVVDTWYSERGSEMKVYAPEDESLVLFAGRDKRSTFRSLLNRLVGLLAFLVPPSIAVGLLANWSTPDAVGDVGPSGQGGSDSGASPGIESASNEDVEEAGGGGDDFSAADASETPTPSEDTMATDTPHPSPDGGAGTETPSVADTPVPEPTDVPDNETIYETANQTMANTVDPTPQVPVEAADSAAEIAGLDPGIAAGLAFFVGGLFVYVVLSYRSTRV